jgi:hypothetical protein
MPNDYSLRDLLKWDLINTGCTLINRFAEQSIDLNIIIIKADFMKNETFSKYIALNIV